MTQEEYDAQFDKIHACFETRVAKINSVKASSSFTETLDKRQQRLADKFSDALDLLDESFEQVFLQKRAE